MFKKLLNKLVVEPWKDSIEKVKDPIGSLSKGLNFSMNNKDHRKLKEEVEKMIRNGEDVPNYLRSHGVMPKPGEELYEIWQANNKKFANLRRMKEQVYFENLISNYGEDIAQKIQNKELWIGMDINHINEVKGKYDYKVENLINKVAQTILYFDKHKNRLGNDAYDFEITLEHGKVVGWKNRPNVATGVK
jgi:hypothetical protein